MSNPYIGEIRMFAGNFAPAGWAFCDGALIPISENDALFNLIGTTYGGDGQETFALPNLCGRVPIHQGTVQGQTFVLGAMAGTETETLSIQQIPAHSHSVRVSGSPGYAASPANAVLARDRDLLAYNNGNPSGAALRVESVGANGGSQPHDNLPPFLCINFIISLFGIFPSQT